MRKGTVLIGSVLASWVVVLAPAAILGCAPISIGTPAGDQRTVYQAESDFAGALTLAVAYEHSGHADPAVVSKVRLAAESARTGLYTAEALSRAGSGQSQIQAALAGVTDFVKLVGGLK